MSKIAWKSVPGWEHYQVSNTGRVRSVTRIISTKQGKKRLKGRKMTPQSNKAGYMQILFSCNGKRKMFLIHQLVLLSFVGPCPEGMVACHKDGNNGNNNLNNLRWDTRAENEADKVRHGTKENRKGQNNPRSILTKEQVDKIRNEYSWGNTSYSKLAKKYGVSKGCIGSLVRGENWGPTEPESITTVVIFENRGMVNDRL